MLSRKTKQILIIRQSSKLSNSWKFHPLAPGRCRYFCPQSPPFPSHRKQSIFIQSPSDASPSLSPRTLPPASHKSSKGLVISPPHRPYQLDIDHRRPHVRVPQQFLQTLDIHLSQHQMRRKRMPERVPRHPRSIQTRGQPALHDARAGRGNPSDHPPLRSLPQESSGYFRDRKSVV